METSTATVPPHDIPMRRRRRPLVDYRAIDEENARKAAQAGKEVVKKEIPDPVIGKEHPHGKPAIPPAAPITAAKPKNKHR